MLSTIHISRFLQEHYDNKHLSDLLDHAKKNLIDLGDFASCLLGLSNKGYDYHNSREYPWNHPIEIALSELGNRQSKINQAMLPIIQAEIDRRAALIANQIVEEEELVIA